MNELPKNIQYVVIALAVGLLVGFLAGKFSHPKKFQSVDTSSEVQTLRNKLALLEKENKELKASKATFTTTKFSPKTGKKTSQRSVEFSSTVASSESSVGLVGQQDTRSAHLLQKSLVQENQPDWSVSALIGIHHKWGQQLSQPAGGVVVERRILGPLKVGGWFIGGPGFVSGGASIGGQF